MKDKYYFLNSLNIGILVLDSDMQVLFINQWLKSKLSASTLSVGTKLMAQEGVYERFFMALESTLKSGLSHMLTSKLNHLPIELFHGKTALSYNVSISQLSAASSDQESKILLQFTDVTQVKEREDYLKFKQKEIDDQREKSFYQERLSALGELTSSIAHEINNPLAIMDLNYQTLHKMISKKGLLDEKFEDIFLEGKTTIKRITELIRSVRDLAHAPALEEYSRECLATVLNSALVVLTEKSRNMGVDLQIDLAQEIFTFPFDMNRPLIGQVFVNLLNNALHAVRDLDEKWIKITGEVTDEKIKIRFVDSGPGIPKEDQDKIFLPFYTTKDIGEGTGLGLSTCLKIVQGHHGEMKVDNLAAHTTFLIELPINQN